MWGPYLGRTLSRFFSDTGSTIVDIDNWNKKGVILLEGQRQSDLNKDSFIIKPCYNFVSSLLNKRQRILKNLGYKLWFSI